MVRSWCVGLGNLDVISQLMTAMITFVVSSGSGKGLEMEMAMRVKLTQKSHVAMDYRSGNGKDLLIRELHP